MAVAESSSRSRFPRSQSSEPNRSMLSRLIFIRLKDCSNLAQPGFLVLGLRVIPEPRVRLHISWRSRITMRSSTTKLGTTPQHPAERIRVQNPRIRAEQGRVIAPVRGQVRRPRVEPMPTPVPRRIPVLIQGRIPALIRALKTERIQGPVHRLNPGPTPTPIPARTPPLIPARTVVSLREQAPEPVVEPRQIQERKQAWEQRVLFRPGEIIPPALPPGCHW